MTQQFINPNYHPLLVHFPIALLFAGTAIELFCFLGWRRHAFRAAGRWMILVGAMAAIPAAFSGIYALHDVVADGVSGGDAEGSWHQLATVSPLVKQAAAWSMLVRHTWLQSIAAGVALLVVTTWIGSSDLLRERLYALFVLILLGAVGCMAAGGWSGGELVYRHALGVMNPAHAQPVATGLDYYVDPMQVHVIGAGTAVALAFAAMGLAFRSMVIARTPEGFHGIAQALGAYPESLAAEAPLPAPATMKELSARVPSARFALLTSLAALLTAAGGWWLLARDGGASVLAWRDLWMWIRDTTQNSGFWLTRRLAHVICGSAIVVIPLLLALVTRFFPRSRLLHGVLALLLVAAISGQVWLGVVLLNDSNAGPVTRFNAQ